MAEPVPTVTVISRPTNERSSRIAVDSMDMSDEENRNPEIHLPTDEEEVIDMTGAETDEEKALAVAQARLIGDLE